MADDFTKFIPEARAFLSELALNNKREWFHDNKSRFDAQIKTPAKHLLNVIAPQLSEKLDVPVTTKLFRANRDVRFSKDKTPYTLHVHMLWTAQGATAQPSYFFGIAKEYVTAGAGIMGFDKTQQSAWRAWVSEREGDHLQARIDAALSQGATLREAELKRVPAPFGKDHPRGDLLRRKSMTLWKDIESDAASDLPAAILSAFKLFDPVMDDLRAFL
ncbi:TIGR02453 family protein [Planktotalea sp.]|uniref:TIGR02453 family protein n=1 Tax=Planktotalea sp. TaxID=2029877 RepID=UPI003D6C6777